MVRIVMAAWMALALVLVGLSLGRAAELPHPNKGDGEQLTLAVQVKSADHELAEGYFSLGDTATVMAKPGTDLHRFLSRQRGQKVTLVLTPAETRELSRLSR